MDARSRRDFLIAGGSTLAATALSGCSDPSSATRAFTQFLPSRGFDGDPNTVYDVAVVGAGCAGIGAARTVAAYRRKAIVLEAQDYVGGRALTLNTGFPHSVDLGGQYFHQVLSNNPLLQVAQAMGLPTVNASTAPKAFYRGSERLDPKTNLDLSDFFATYAAVNLDIDAAGARAAKGNEDISCGKAIAELQNEPYYKLAVDLITGERTLVPPSESSSEDFYNFSVISPTPVTWPPGDDWLIPSGMGNFIVRLAKGLPIYTNTPVSSISYGPAGVTLKTPKRLIKARTVIVTASAGVLNANPPVIAFEPHLPAQMRSWLRGTRLGDFYKAIFGFKGNPFARNHINEMTFFTQLANSAQPAALVDFWNTNMAVIYLSGELAIKYENMGANAAGPLLNWLDSALPGTKAAWDGSFLGTTWLTNPYTQGSYSYVIPGNAAARTGLARGIKDRLWFAGEAISLSSHGTLHGAWRSGIDAAYAALNAIGVDVRRA